MYLCSDRISLDIIESLTPKIIVSYNYKYLISEDIIQYVQGNIVNLHISYLPWNRGAHPNFWSFIDDTPKGVSIHLIDQGLDTGNVIVQRRIQFDESKETFRSSYDRLNREIVALFQENWCQIKQGKNNFSEQTGEGSYHKSKDLELLLKGQKLDWNESICTFKEKYGMYKRG